MCAWSNWWCRDGFNQQITYQKSSTICSNSIFNESRVTFPTSPFIIVGNANDSIKPWPTLNSQHWDFIRDWLDWPWLHVDFLSCHDFFPLAPPFFLHSKLSRNLNVRTTNWTNYFLTQLVMAIIGWINSLIFWHPACKVLWSHNFSALSEKGIQFWVFRHVIFRKNLHELSYKLFWGISVAIIMAHLSTKLCLSYFCKMRVQLCCRKVQFFNEAKSTAAAWSWAV